jgi:hypothetical protein
MFRCVCRRWARITTKYEYDKGILDCGCGDNKDSKVYYKHRNIDCIESRYPPFCACEYGTSSDSINLCSKCFYTKFSEVPKYESPNDLEEPLEVMRNEQIRNTRTFNNQ